MICENCGSDKSHDVNGYSSYSMLLGDSYLSQVVTQRCDDCGEIFLDAKNWDLVDCLVAERERMAIGKIPVDQFVSAKKASVMLNITKQAFNKDTRIKHGFIIQRVLDDADTKILYYKPSVEKYGIDRDGRIRINEASGDGIQRVSIPISHISTVTEKYEISAEVISYPIETVRRNAQEG